MIARLRSPWFFRSYFALVVFGLAYAVVGLAPVALALSLVALLRGRKWFP